MSNIQKLSSFRLRHLVSGTNRSWVSLAATILMICILLLSFSSSFGDNLLHTSKLSVKAAAPLIRRIYAPFFTSAVPFNQTAIFWFGDVTSTDNYTDVRIGYNQSELYIDLRIVDRYLWYDTNSSAPNLANGDNASIYLDTVGTSRTLDRHAYQFQTGVNGHIKRPNYQKAYTGNGTTWTAANIPFTTDYWWRGHGFNGAQDDKGWSMTYHIPFSSLGVSAPAALATTLWKLAVKVHNRNNAANTPLPDKWWANAGNDTQPAGWGELLFGLPKYQPPQASHTATYTVRNKLNNQVVSDGMVGGSLGCGSNVADTWTQLGSQSYPGAVHVNIMNEADMSDWNCFSKYYITFPLSSLPHGKGVIKAAVTLYETGNDGVQGQPNPSYIQVATVNEDWNPATLSWNNAPLVKENITSIRVNTKPKPVISWPGLAITWDVSLAVADAYASGQPLRLVFYSTDNQYNSGKFFTSSSVGDWDANGRPTLQVTLQA